jgi:hypothetical protein
MYKWFKVNLGDAMLATRALAELEVQLSNIYAADDKPTNMLAVYHHASKGMHCSVIVYLTATFQRSVLLKSAISCEVPLMADMGFLAGNKERMKD